MTAPLFPRNARWPLPSSQLAGAHAPVILEALNDPAMLVYTGWYVDDLARGPVWHRWAYQIRKHAAPRIGLAFLAALYGLASHGIVELTRVEPRAPVRVSLAPGDASVPTRSLEHTIARALSAGGVSPDGQPGISIDELLERVLPGDRRLLKHHARDWLRDRGIEIAGGGARPEDVIAALGLAAELVALEAGVGLEAPHADALEEMLAVIELATLRRVASVFRG